MQTTGTQNLRRALRVLVIGDSHAALAEAQLALRWEPTLRVTLITDSLEQLNRSFGSDQPDVFVLVNLLPGPALQEGLRRLSAIFKNPRTVVTYKSQPVAMSMELLKAGCKGVIAHSSVKRQLLRAVLAVAAGELWLGRSDLARLLEQNQVGVQSQKSSMPQTDEAITALLTQGEQRIMAHVVKGMTNKEIARALGISDKTVKTHISHILKKFGVSRRQQMIFGMSGYYQSSSRTNTSALISHA